MSPASFPAHSSRQQRGWEADVWGVGDVGALVDGNGEYGSPEDMSHMASGNGDVNGKK